MDIIAMAPLWVLLFALLHTGRGDDWSEYAEVLPKQYFDTIEEVGRQMNVSLTEVVREAAPQSARLFLETLDGRRVYLAQYVSCACPVRPPVAELLDTPFQSDYKDVVATYNKGYEYSHQLGHLVDVINNTCPRAEYCRMVYGRRMLDICAGKHDFHLRDLFWQRLLVAEYPDWFKPLLHCDFMVWFSKAWQVLLEGFSPSYRAHQVQGPVEWVPLRGPRPPAPIGHVGREVAHHIKSAPHF